MLSPNKTPSARIGIYPNVCLLLTFQKYTADKQSGGR